MKKFGSESAFVICIKFVIVDALRTNIKNKTKALFTTLYPPDNFTNIGGIKNIHCHKKLLQLVFDLKCFTRQYCSRDNLKCK